MAWYDDVKTGTIVSVGVISIVFTYVTIIVVQGLVYQVADYESSRKAAMAGETSLQKIMDQQEQQLKQYAWVDKQAGVATIPINVAKDKVLNDLTSKK